MYMTNEEWEQNNQDYLKESYEETVLPPEDTPSANLSAAAAVGCSTPPSTPRNTVTATGAAIRPTIGGSGNTAKCAVRIWSASAVVKNLHPNVKVPTIAAMPVGKKTIENVLQMLQVLKMSTWISVTHLPNETQFLTNEGTEIYRPVTENQVVKMSTSFFRNASRPVENQVAKMTT